MFDMRVLAVQCSRKNVIPIFKDVQTVVGPALEVDDLNYWKVISLIEKTIGL